MTARDPRMVDAAMAAVAATGLRLARDNGTGMEYVDEYPDDERDYTRGRNWRDFTERAERLQDMRRRKVVEAVLDAVDPLWQADTVPVDRGLLRAVETARTNLWQQGVDGHLLQLNEMLRRLPDPDQEPPS